MAEPSCSESDSGESQQLRTTSNKISIVHDDITKQSSLRTIMFSESPRSRGSVELNMTVIEHFEVTLR